ncbi:hypothetical protein CAAN1_01S07624 [[Candida] anglica]|uniref:Uncharacterized protein n=1 Tax=[Candida] anglica TaxID=148631 RepID=A0ABP0EK99_9ASCO
MAGPLLLQPVNWSALGYPILDTAASYPYVIEVKNGTKITLYDEGPAAISEGDIYKLQLNTAQMQVNGKWYQIGAVHSDGKYLRISNEFVRHARLDTLNSTNFASFEAAEDYIRELEDEMGDQSATDEMTIGYFKGMLSAKGKSLNDGNTEVIIKFEDR